MEHEVYVPFPVGSVRAALSERTRVTRCVPGLQLAAAEGAGDAVEGRLRVRAGGHTITYRGSLKITGQGDGFTVRGTGGEVRGSGTVKLRLKVVPRRADDGEGTRLVCSGKVTGDGRIADLEPKMATAAGHRLLDRFGTALAESMRTEPPAAPADSGAEPEAEPDAELNARAAAGIGEPDDNDRAIPGIPGPEKGGADRGDRKRGKQSPEDAPAGDDRTADQPGDPGDTGTGAEADAADAPDATDDADDGTPDVPGAGPTTGGIFDAEIPPPSLDPRTGAEEDADEGMDDTDGVDETTAEAAHARRTMIGRSAEEVDHAPPRGRYAPVPAPEDAAATATLRWAAPAAALVLAGAVVLGRALRRRR
ncbi:hypothetical protein DVA86_03220 [Streptomyces armeniacus]|uniref:Carbon monoxide dehydrogenase n=1 Tax=Streptomyces armeniacus TaxID=83291 RepID=A0A345XJI4_9ACTN|nr:hypothetical protein [Streptomyces armeniacus]AXK31800.1 hypothetical protein DVA86_03220 [Streptomyces armeniacus]